MALPIDHPLRRIPALLILLLLLPALAPGQPVEEDFRPWTEHPRLFLNERRLRLLKRERERDSIRWQQFNTLVAGGAPMAEPGFAAGLYYQVSGDPAYAQKAIEWAARNSDLRQLALVYDWCRSRMTGAQAKSIAGRIRRGIELSLKATDIPTVRSRALAAVAIAEDDPELAERELRRLVREWWRAGIGARLKDGRATLPQDHLYAFFELMHAVRDNIQIDLRESAAKYFTDLPAWHLLSHYPATFPAAENEYRVPVFSGAGDPDLDLAAMSRAAQLAMVAYDTNARANQYVQGWLIHDRFLMRGVLGIVYEFLWANPYQPGLSYYHLPLQFHEPRTGHLFVRSSWEDDATWFGLFGGRMQVFQDGQVHTLTPRGRREPLTLAEVTIVFSTRFKQSLQPSGRFFVVGLKPRTPYLVEVDHEELRELTSDAGGVLAFEFPPDGKAEVRIGEIPAK
jgi:hypothetical protein